MSCALGGVLRDWPPAAMQAETAMPIPAARAIPTPPRVINRVMGTLGRAACAAPRVDGRTTVWAAGSDPIAPVCRSPIVVGQATQQRSEPGSAAGAATLDRPLGNAEQDRRLGYRIAVHIDGHYRGALLGGQAHQCLTHQ